MANFRLGGHLVGMESMSETYDLIVLCSGPGGYIAAIHRVRWSAKA